VGLRVDLDAEARRKILCPCRGSNPGRPGRSQTLYRLSYRGSSDVRYDTEIKLRMCESAYNGSSVLNVKADGTYGYHLAEKG
jgi:hypothetical protein